MPELSVAVEEGDARDVSLDRRHSGVARKAGHADPRTLGGATDEEKAAQEPCTAATRQQQDYVEQQLLLCSPPPALPKECRSPLGVVLLQERSASGTEQAAVAETAAAAEAAAKKAAIDAVLLEQAVRAFPEVGQVLLLQQHVNQQLERLLQTQQQLQNRKLEAGRKEASSATLHFAEEAERAQGGAEEDETNVLAGLRALLKQQRRPSAAPAAAAAAEAETDTKEEPLLQEEPLQLETLLSAGDRSFFTELMLTAKKKESTQKRAQTPPRREPAEILSPERVLEAFPAVAAAFRERDLEMGVAAGTCSGVVDPRSCRVFGEGLQKATAGAVAQFQVQAVSPDGYFLRRGGTRFTAILEPDSPAATTTVDSSREPQRPHGELVAAAEDAAAAASAEDPKQRERFSTSRKWASSCSVRDAHIYDNGDGTYTVSYFCTQAVPHTLSIYLDDRHPVAKSPYRVQVEPGAVCPSRSCIYGAGVKTFARNGEVNEVFVQLRDAHGNDVKRGGEDIKTLSRGAAKIIETRDLHNGRFWVTYFVPTGAEENFVEIHVLHGQQHVKNSPFRPAADPAPAAAVHPRRLPTFSSETKLETQASFVTPYVSLKQLQQEFDEKSRCGAHRAPALPTFPPFPSALAALEALSKADISSTEGGCAKRLNDTTQNFFRNTTTELLQHGKAILGRENLLRELVERVQGHGDAGAVHHYIEERSRQTVENISSSIAAMQNYLDTVYKSIQHGVVSTLPVAFEIEDPEEIRAAHKKRREALVQRHRILEKKQQELRLRERRLTEGRVRFVTDLAAEIQRRRDILSQQRAALRENVNYTQRLSQLSLKRHLRREMLLAGEREAVEAFKSQTWQRDFSRMLREEGPLIGGGAAAASAAAAGRAAAQREAAAAPPHLPKPPSVCPDDPLRPATWFFKGVYCEPLEGFAALRKLPPAAGRVLRPSPTCVAVSERKFSASETINSLQQQKKQPAGVAFGASTRSSAVDNASLRKAAESRKSLTTTAAAPAFSLPKKSAEERRTPPTAAADTLPSFGRGGEGREAATAAKGVAAAAAAKAAVAEEKAAAEAKKEEEALEDDYLPPPGMALKDIPRRIYVQFPPLPPPHPPPRRM